MRIQLVVGFAVASLGLSTFACSSATPPFQQVSEYCSAYANAVCGISQVCQQSVGSEFTSAACQSYQDTQCMAAASAAQSAGRVYTPGAVQNCINALNNAFGNSPSTVSPSSYASACNAVFPGTAAEGAACTSDADCAVSGDICASAPGVGKQCATVTPKQLNDVCNDPGDECPSSSYCGSVTTSNGTTNECVACGTNNPPGTCVSPGTVGSDCNVDTDCVSGLFCDTYVGAGVPSPQCESSYQFSGRGSVDCLGFEGQANGTGSSSSSGSSSGGSSGSSSGSSSGGSDGGTAGDAPSGG